MKEQRSRDGRRVEVVESQRVKKFASAVTGEEPVTADEQISAAVLIAPCYYQMKATRFMVRSKTPKVFTFVGNATVTLLLRIAQ